MSRVFVIHAIRVVRAQVAAHLVGQGAKLYRPIGALLLGSSIAACVPTPTATVTPVTMLLLPTVTPATTVIMSTYASAPGATDIASTTTTMSATGEVAADPEQASANEMEANRLNIIIGDTVLSATLAENSSVDALRERLAEGPMTVNMRDYGSMEKVGPLGMSLPRNDQQITTEAGDMILYQGNALVVYYAPNSWNFTRLGKIDDVSADELRGILGDGNVTVTLALP